MEKSHIVEEWEVDVTVQTTVTFKRDECEDEEGFRAWLKTPEGQRYLRSEVRSEISSVHTYYAIDEVRLKETEVRKSDFDPRL